MRVLNVRDNAPTTLPESVGRLTGRHTALTNVFTGRPARAIVNRFANELDPISAVTPAFPLATTAVAPVRARAECQGSGDFSALWSGQNPSGCKEIAAADLTRALSANL